MKPAIWTMCLLLGAAMLPTPPALADSGQLRDPTRCGQGPANCRKMPPSASERIQSTPRGDDRQQRKSSQPLMRTSPLPSEFIRTPAPSSTGLDKGSTGLRKSPLGH